jgi:hypothetical protein
MGGVAGVALFVLVVVVLGVIAPLYFSLGFMTLRVLLTYTCLPFLVVPPIVAESVAGERELKPESRVQRRDWLYGKVGAGALYGWASVWFILALAIASLRASVGRFLPPSAPFGLGLVLLSLASSLFAAAFAAAVSMGARSVKGAKRTMRQGVLLLLIVVIFLWRQSWPWARRLAVPETGAGFLEFSVVISVVLAGFSAGLVRLALHASDTAEIRLNL